MIKKHNQITFGQILIFLGIKRPPRYFMIETFVSIKRTSDTTGSVEWMVRGYQNLLDIFWNRGHHLSVIFCSKKRGHVLRTIFAKKYLKRKRSNTTLRILSVLTVLSFMSFDIINLYLYSCILTSPKMCMVVLMLSRLVINIHGPACLPP